MTGEGRAPGAYLGAGAGAVIPEPDGGGGVAVREAGRVGGAAWLAVSGRAARMRCMRFGVAAVALGLVFLLAQASGAARKRTKARADGGTDGGPVLLGPDPPGRLRPDPPGRRDGGIALPDGGGSDGGAHATQSQQIEELRARIAALEQQASASQQQAQEMVRMNQQIQALRQQLADADARRQDEERQAQRRKQSTQAAIESLTAAQNQLAIGNSGIEDALSQAQSAFTGQAQRDIEAARTALQNSDLAAARAMLSAAIVDAQQGR